ncbi:LacI family DNA-binding transcriptional regulator [Agromyces albus]|uniref:LacI family DNA-binding transcriptional regulator n=1 Tax=Agromyces albus TaxID=205332 RepID=UPI00277E90AE|nr:LacI family DNA-binding transcriptional regulator [Agromyces albus]MDQ0576757.1 LacI family transcriptional regulator [Agromyces albus]
MASDSANGRRETTVSDVAAAAKVSKATAARALGDYGAVSDAVRDRVLAAAEQLGYRPNALAKTMSTGKSHTIGIVVGDIENPFFAQATRGVSDVAKAAGFDLLLSNSDEEVDAEDSAIAVLLAKRVDGLIVAPASSVDTQSLQSAIATGRPLVLFDRAAEGVDVDTVVADNRAGASRLAELLLAAGHRRIAFVSTIGHPAEYRAGDRLASSSVGDRVAGFVASLQEAGVPEPERFVRLNARRDGVDTIVRELLGDGATAIVASDSLVAQAAFRTIRDLGLVIPHDVSLVAFDDADWTSLSAPAITVMSQPIHEIGAEAARLLVRRMAGHGGPAETTVLPQRLIERESIAPPRPPVR